MSLKLSNAWIAIVKDKNLPKSVNICLSCNEIFIDEDKFKEHMKGHDQTLILNLINFEIKCSKCKSSMNCPQRIIDACLKAIPVVPYSSFKSGFPNLGNSCYTSSVFAALAHCKSLVTALVTSSEPICRLFAASITVNRKLNQILHAVIPQFSPTHQEDAAEFLLSFIDKLCNDPHVKMLFGGYLSYSQQCTKCNHTASNVQKFTMLPVDISGHGWIPVEEINNETKVPRSFGVEEFWEENHHCDSSASFVSFMMHGSTERISLEKCLESMFSPGYITCSECKNPKATITNAIISLPEILILQFNRFTKRWFGVGKVFQFIDFPFEGEVDFGHFIPKDINCGPTKYTITAIISHIGTMGYGHYICYCLEEGKWVLYNDEIVKVVSAEEAISSQSYILIYTRIMPDEVKAVNQVIDLSNLPFDWGIPLKTISDPQKWVGIIPESSLGQNIIEMASQLAGGTVTRSIVTEDIRSQYIARLPFTARVINISEEDLEKLWVFLFENGEYPTVVPVPQSDFAVGEIITSF